MRMADYANIGYFLLFHERHAITERPPTWTNVSRNPMKWLKRLHKGVIGDTSTSPFGVIVKKALVSAASRTFFNNIDMRYLNMLTLSKG